MVVVADERQVVGNDQRGTARGGRPIGRGNEIRVSTVGEAKRSSLREKWIGSGRILRQETPKSV